MSAKYILRFDDACPTMDKRKWDKIETICDKYEIKPLIAVIPNNKDKSMMVDKYDEKFWDKIRDWQKKGWHIALHGFEHLYVTNKSGFLPFNKQSEFAGLSLKEQMIKIKKGWAIFQKEQIKSNIWIAPSHTFDRNTLLALKQETNIDKISDGIALFPFIKYEFKWLPQQVWKFRKMPFGVWTSCFHPNTMNENEFHNLELFIKENKDDFIDIEKLKYKQFCMMNIIFKYIFLGLLKIKRLKK